MQHDWDSNDLVQCIKDERFTHHSMIADPIESQANDPNPLKAPQLKPFQAPGQ